MNAIYLAAFLILAVSTYLFWQEMHERNSPAYSFWAGCEFAASIAFASVALATGEFLFWIFLANCFCSVVKGHFDTLAPGGK